MLWLLTGKTDILYGSFSSHNHIYLVMIIVKSEVGGKPENCVTFSSPKGITRTVSRDLLKVFEFCKMF